MIRQVTKIFFTLVMLAVLGACSGDDSTTINIEQPSNNGGGNSGGGDSSGGDSGGDSRGETPAECPEVRLQSAKDCANCLRRSDLT